VDWILADPPGGVRDPHVLQQLDGTPACLAPPQPLVDAQRLADLVADGVDGVERPAGVLEDDGDVAAVGVPVVLGEVVAPEVDRAALDPAGLVDETEDRAGGDGLARAGLADEADRLALVDVEADAVDGVDRLAVGMEDGV